MNQWIISTLIILHFQRIGSCFTGEAQYKTFSIEKWQLLTERKNSNANRWRFWPWSLNKTLDLSTISIFNVFSVEFIWTISPPLCVREWQVCSMFNIECDSCEMFYSFFNPIIWSYLFVRHSHSNDICITFKSISFSKLTLPFLYLYSQYINLVVCWMILLLQYVSENV